MTVSLQQTVFPYTGNGSATVYPFGCRILDADDLVVTVDGATKTRGLDYSVLGVGSTVGGVVAFVVAPGNTLPVRIFRQTKLTRGTDYQIGGDFDAPVVNADFDRAMMALQDFAGGALEVRNALRVPAGESLNELPAAVARANRLQAYDSAGQPVALVGIDAGSATALDLSLRSAALATAGAGQLGFSRALTYPAGTVGEELQKREFIADLRTSNNGAQNDAAVLAAAARAQAAGGGIVVLPPGDFQHVSIVWNAITYSKVSLRGAGKKATILRKTGATTSPVLDVQAATLHESFMSISDFSIEGNAYGSPGLRTTLIALFSVRNLCLGTCSVGWDNVGSMIASVYDTDLRANVVGYKQAKSGIQYPNLISFYGGQVIGNTSIGFDIVNGHGFTWDHVDIEFNGVAGNAATGGVFIRSTTNEEISYGNFTFTNNCWFEQNLGPHLTVENAPGILLTLMDTKFIRNLVGQSSVAMTVGAIESVVLKNVFALSSLSGNLTVTLAAQRSIVDGGLIGILNDNSTTYVHREVGTSSALIQFKAGSATGNSMVSHNGASFGGDVNVLGTKVSKRYTVPAAGTVVTTIPVGATFNDGGLGGVLIFIRGLDNATGVAAARLYLVAVKAAGGSGADVAAVQVGTAGNTTPTFTFTNSGGFLAITAANANPAYASVFGA